MIAESGIEKWKQFLEATPPNSPVTIPGVAQMQPNPLSGERMPCIISPPIELHCERDGGSRRFTTSKKLFLRYTSSHQFLTFRCRDCLKSEKIFAIAFKWDSLNEHTSGEVTVMKMGEYPPFSTAISPRIQKLLTRQDLELYRKGVRSMDYGLGIGAASYLRRIVESQWKLVVIETRKAAERLGIKDLKAFDAALESHQFSRAVESLKGVIPEKLLLPGRHNPLTILYKPLSQQLHDLSDEECLQQAQAIQIVLTKLLENIATVLKDEAELSAAVSMLQNSTNSVHKRKRSSGP